MRFEPNTPIHNAFIGRQVQNRVPLSSLFYSMEDSLDQSWDEPYEKSSGNEYRFLYWE